MLRCVLLSFVCLLSAVSSHAAWETTSEEEALFLRRIADFWHEGEYHLVKHQIESFLAEFPDSAFAQSLSATLGDLYLREQDYKRALMLYARARDPDIVQRTFLNRMQCLLELQWYATLSDECEAYLQTDSLDPALKLRGTYLLAIALYQQCLNQTRDEEALQRLGARARPHFETLYQSEFSEEISKGYAHLCFLLKDYASAEKIYRDLALKEGYDKQEMLFQAAVLQAEYDKERAMELFSAIAQEGKSRSDDALYNQIVLIYDSGRFEELLEHKNDFLARLTSARKLSARFFFGKTHLHLKQLDEGVADLMHFIKRSTASDLVHSACLLLIDAAFQADDENALNVAIAKLEQFEGDPHLPKGLFTRALLLKKHGKLDSARSEFETLKNNYPDTSDATNALFELANLELHAGKYRESRSLCREFLERSPNLQLIGFAWRCLATASAKLAETEKTSNDLILDLEALLQTKEILTQQERGDWAFLLAKTYYEQGQPLKAIERIEPLLDSDAIFPEKANAMLLYALCQRDAHKDLKLFCQKAEEALSLNATLMSEEALHISLYNAYLSDGSEPALLAAAEHLYKASERMPIKQDNLLWLAGFYRSKPEPKFLGRALKCVERFLHSSQGKEGREQALVLQAELYGLLGQPQIMVSLLQELKNRQEELKDSIKIDRLLAVGYTALGQTKEAIELFDQIVAKQPTARTYDSALSALYSARLKAEELRKDAGASHLAPQILSQLKTLVLQKTLANEPIHLEAGLEYVDLQVELEPVETQKNKRLSLLLQTKLEFETTEDLLSKDYHLSRSRMPEQDRMVQAYLALYDAEIILAQALLAEGEEAVLLQQRAREQMLNLAKRPATPFLAERIAVQLERMDAQ